MHLFGNRESGHSYKASLMLWFAGIGHEYTEIDIDTPREARPEPFRTLAKYGEVPLLLHDKHPYVQSNAILIHLAEHSGVMGGESPQRLERVREWLFWEANRIGFSLPNLRYGLKFTKGGLKPDVELMLRLRLDSDLERLEDELTDCRAFNLDDQPSAADLALCAYLYWADQASVNVPPNVQAWLGRIASLPGWRHPYDPRG